MLFFASSIKDGLYLLRRPELHRQFSGYEPDGLLLPYPAMYKHITIINLKGKIDLSMFNF